jgi:hypothetical protein
MLKSFTRIRSLITLVQQLRPSLAERVGSCVSFLLESVPEIVIDSLGHALLSNSSCSFRQHYGAMNSVIFWTSPQLSRRCLGFVHLAVNQKRAARSDARGRMEV